MDMVHMPALTPGQLEAKLRAKLLNVSFPLV